MRYSAGLLSPRYWGRAPCVVAGLLPEDSSDSGYLRFAEALTGLLVRRAGAPCVYAPAAPRRRWWQGQPPSTLNPEGHSPAAALSRAARLGSFVRGTLDFPAASGLPLGAHVVVDPGDPLTWLAVPQVAPACVERLFEELGTRIPSPIDWEARAGTRFRTDFDRAWIGPHDTAGWCDGARSVSLQVATGIEPAEVYLPAIEDTTDPWLRRSLPQIAEDFRTMGVRVVIVKDAGWWMSDPSPAQVP